MQMIEVTANSVEAAIDKGLAELNARPGEVVVEVLEEPNTGLFGFGAREARVRLVLIGTRSKDEADEFEESDEQVDESPPRAPSPGLPDDELEEDALVGKQVLQDLLERMGVDARVAVQRAEDDDEGDDPHWMLNISGDRVNRLIGRRGETLSSLQHIVRLICSRRLERRANIIVDAGGYKSGRSKRLRGLANRMAKQAVQQGRTITLEPMHPNERRIIHLTLRGRNDVMTQSVGEGRGRKVTIVPR
ncbi:MAG: Jag N-terminal domain-containing protein [Anaerolineae bacterium]|nr:Jag N-terminal domain-containing protein [Anaerolineae bacterium]